MAKTMSYLQTLFTFHKMTVILGFMLVSHRVLVTAISALTLFTGIIVGIYLDNLFIIVLFSFAKYVIMMPLVGYLFPNSWGMLAFLWRRDPEYENRGLFRRCAGEENTILHLMTMEILSYFGWWRNV